MSSVYHASGPQWPGMYLNILSSLREDRVRRTGQNGGSGTASCRRRAGGRVGAVCPEMENIVAKMPAASSDIPAGEISGRYQS